VQENKANGEEQDGDVKEDDVREYRRRKRRIIIEESDNDVALRTQQVQDERKPMKRGKYQRLNKFGSSNHEMYLKDNSSMNDTRKRDITFMQRKET